VAQENGLRRGPNGQERCWWHGGDPEYRRYHDEEWGRPVADDRRLFEKICLEGFQAGLSWLTILRKRDNFRQAFANFEVQELVQFGDHEAERLLQDASIIRHRKKIKSVLNNAHRALELQREYGSLAHFFWQFEPRPEQRPAQLDYQQMQQLTSTAASAALSKALKRRAWSFVGPTTAYAFMQSMGLVNDHLQGCAFRQKVEQERQEFIRP